MIFLACVCACWIQNKTEDCWVCQVTFQWVNKWLSTLKWLEKVNKPGKQHTSHSLQHNVAIAHSLHIHHPIPSFLSMEIQNLFWIEYRVRNGVCHWNGCRFWSCVNYRNVRTDNPALQATFWSRLSTSRAEMFWLLADALWCLLALWPDFELTLHWQVWWFVSRPVLRNHLTAVEFGSAHTVPLRACVRGRCSMHISANC